MKKYLGILLVGFCFGLCGASSADVYQCRGGFSGDKKPVEVFPDEFKINMCIDTFIHRNGTIIQHRGNKEPFRTLRIFAKGGMEDNPKALVEWSNRRRYYECQWIQKPCGEKVPEVTASSPLKTLMSGRSDNQVCVHSNNGQPKYIEEAKRRGLSCGVNKTSTSDVGTTSPVPETKSTNPAESKASKLDKAKSTCKDIGFTAGTEKFGECVLKLIDQKLVQTNTETPKQNSNSAEYKVTEDIALFKATSRGFQHSQYVKKNYWNAKSKKTFKELEGKNKLQMWMAPPPCPTKSWWSYPNKSEKALKKWALSVNKKLETFPPQTIKECSIPSDVIINGKMTNHPINNKHFNRDTGTMILKRGGKISPFQVIVEQDYLGDRQGGAVYNEALIKVCEFEFAGKSKASVNCNSFGSFDAVFRITNIIKGSYKFIGRNSNFEFLVTNKSLVETKTENPELFRKNWSN